MKKLGIIGARGYVGGELIRLLAAHQGVELQVVSSRQLAGERVCDHFEHPSELRVVDLSPQDVSGEVDAWILALPNGHAAQWVDAITAHRSDAILVDLSADFRFDDRWTYGFTERDRERVRGSRRISNPGCYATAIQAAIAPVVPWLSAAPVAFGVSGYSGAGTTPSPKNDPELLRDNLMPYALVDHMHEREVSRHLRHPVRFMPHVAGFFRGISVTVSLEFQRATSRDTLLAHYREVWDGEPLIEVIDETPWVRDIAHRHHVCVGGVTVSADGHHAVVVSTVDNLLKGAATQALQNLNLALGLPELMGIA